MIHNPILKGFNPDPCICRKGDDYYIAVSSFEWYPGIPVYHSRDLKHWELYTHVLQGEYCPDLNRLPSGQGIWAPCLSYCEQEDLFYVVYGCMIPSGVNIDNYVITARDIKGPWSAPVYLQSCGFDASIFHDSNGKKYVVSLEWETRTGYKKPGAICMAEYDPQQKKIVGYPKRIWEGSSGRGWIEGPHIYKYNGWYYILCAEGGTGYHHCAAIGRSRQIWGPYEKDPNRVVITSAQTDGTEGQVSKSRAIEFYNPHSVLQKSGHASLVKTSGGELFAVHLCSRPFVPEMRSILGRETAIQKMKQTKDGWIRKADDSGLAKEYCEESNLSEYPVPKIEDFDHFNSNELGLQYYAPRHDPAEFSDLTSRPGWLRMRGQQSLNSLDKVSLIARKLTSVHAQVTVKMEFEPEVYRHSAGLVMYYNNENYLYLRKYYSDTLHSCALSVTSADKGTVVQLAETRTPVPSSAPLWLRLTMEDKKIWFEWSADGDFSHIGSQYDVTRFSDEYCDGFTGAFVGIACVDEVFRSRWADFDYFYYHNLDEC